MMRETDMYGNPIYPLGETGFGVSISFFTTSPDHQTNQPYFTIFHVSDGFQQSLFSAQLDLDRPRISNTFERRIAEHFANEMHPLGAPSLREDKS